MYGIAGAAIVVGDGMWWMEREEFRVSWKYKSGGKVPGSQQAREGGWYSGHDEESCK